MIILDKANKSSSYSCNDDIMMEFFSKMVDLGPSGLKEQGKMHKGEITGEKGTTEVK